MNASNFAHAALALLAQALIGVISGNWWAGAAFGAAFYFGREVAQFEQHRLATWFESRATMPWYEGFKITHWGTDALLDLAVPVIAVCAVAFIL